MKEQPPQAATILAARILAIMPPVPSRLVEWPAIRSISLVMLATV